MKWSDVARIVYGPIPQTSSVQQEMGTVPLAKELEMVLTRVESFLCRSSEAEAVIRVFIMVVAAIPNTGNIKLSLQPSVSGHSVFTDFLFLATDDASGWPLTFIEVKRFSDSADLSAQYESTAQTYREAQILLCESEWARQGLNELGFVLSNSEMWSFAYAKRRANRIVITKRFSMYVRDCRERVLFCLRSLLMGQWPRAESSGEPSTEKSAPDQVISMEAQLGECEALPPSSGSDTLTPK